MTASSFRATEIVALAQMVLTRDFQGPVRMATAQELLQHARLALGRGETSFAADLAGLASRMMAPGQDLGAELMQVGGGPVTSEVETAAPALPGLQQLALRERAVLLQPAPEPPRPLAPRLASDGTPRGIPRT